MLQDEQVAGSTGDDQISKYRIWKVIGASAVGTMIEWYDFYIFGSLAVIIAPLFYPPGNDTFAYIAYLATFAVGFVVRPFGALFFGRIGDVVGRKYAFLVTLLIMGGATAVIGFLPTYSQIGIPAPIILLLIRVLQGLALGGEYGGAAVYVAEHVPDHRRGFYTSFIQITATLGLFLSLAVILTVQNMMSPEQFAGKADGLSGWRIPFLISIVLVGVSLYIRLRMKESPIFEQVKSAGMTSANPLVEAFTKWSNLKIVLISLFGATAGQGVVWYTGQFYALFYLQSILNVDATSANYIIAIALVLGMPFFVFFGWLSDRWGRKWIMMAGLLLAVFSYLPIYRAMQFAAGSEVITASSKKNPVTGAITLTPLAHESGNPELVVARKVIPYTSFGDLISKAQVWILILLVFIQVIWVTMVYGPIAAYLVEAFPAKIRYTALSLPYHIGNGVFGGLLPLIGVSVIAQTGNIYAGLYYPMAIAAITLIVGTIFLKETHGHKIWAEVNKN
ncbi:MAG: MHS family MFS transporter [Pyrinomonadaceae bacterium]|nr:MHS family MFS transporter [Pyrinomonadaceae bacterium]MBP6211662.1 MHS family MFS transporter [Pyrinomonadaceae bacterium]